jgi:hypothetical protein
VNHKDIPIPNRMKKFPLFHGFPVHYTVFVHSDGTPDFKIMHERRREECFKKNWCHLCGEPLNKKNRKEEEYAFIGGPKCVLAHRFIDGPMDIACAEYAAKVCPFLSSPTGKYASVIPVKEGDRIVEYQNVPNVRPNKMALVVSRKYHVERNPTGNHVSGPHANDPSGEGQLVCVVGKYIRIDWNIMPSNDEVK